MSGGADRSIVLGATVVVGTSNGFLASSKPAKGFFCLGALFFFSGGASCAFDASSFCSVVVVDVDAEADVDAGSRLVDTTVDAIDASNAGSIGSSFDLVAFVALVAGTRTGLGGKMRFRNGSNKYA